MANSTVNKEKVNESNPEPNLLHQYASYNYIFTLSGLTEQQLRDPQNIIGAKPHNIIARSAGIGNANTTPTNANIDLNTTILSDNDKAYTADMQKTLDQARDIYIESVDINSVHAFNPMRRSSSLVKLDIQLVEPYGVTLLDKVRAAALNCGYLTHLGAPFLLTLEFKGFDNLGNPVQIDPNKGKRWIPIYLIKMDISVNTGGAKYDIQAIPYSGQGFLNSYVYTRSIITLDKSNDLGQYMDHIATQLNKQTEDEAKDKKLFTPGMQDTYKIKLDYAFNGKTIGPNNYENSLVHTAGMSQDKQNNGETKPNDIKYRQLGQLPKGTNIVKLIEDSMLSVPAFQNVVSNWTKTMQSKQSTTYYDEATTTTPDSTDIDTSKLAPEDFYVDWFKITSRVETRTEQFDKKTRQHPKIITYFVEPYKIHIYRLTKPGSSAGGADDIKVKKKYDYIFTGQNNDILDLDINYKIAYYQALAKESIDRVTLKDKDSSGKRTDGAGGPSPNTLDAYGTHASASSVSTSSTIKGGFGKDEADLFMDTLANPQADMVNVDLKILGDTSWIGMSQYFDFALDDETKSAAATTNKNREKLGSNSPYNDTYGSYNVETHDPIVRLNFIMPGDINNLKGIYDIGGAKSAVFSGLYQVYAVESSFSNGQFVQVLKMIRFNNQNSGGAGSKIETAKVSYRVDWDSQAMGTMYEDAREMGLE